jgi:hypothetical protein
MSDISKSAIQTDEQFEAEVAKMSFEQIKVAMAERAVQQGLAARDHYDPNVLVAQERPATFVKAVIVDGQTHEFTGATEQEAADALTAFYRSHFAGQEKTGSRWFTKQTTEQTTEERPRDEETGRFTARVELDPVAKSELELKFKRGEISTADYLAQSGAIEEHLESKGISVESLKEASLQNYHKSWADATAEFLQSEAGSTWPGGDENRNIAARLMSENGLTNQPSVETLTRVFQHMKEHDLLVENPEMTARANISSAKTVEEVRMAALASQGRSSSSMFNR